MASDQTTVSGTSRADAHNTETLKTKAQEAAADIRERAHETGEQIREHAEALSAQAQEMASEYFQQGRKKAAEWEQILEKQIRKKPLQSLLVAGGIGLLIGLLWRR